MTPEEGQAITDRQAARRAVLAKFGDGAAEITDDDIRLLKGAEITALANVGRLQHFGIGPDRRLQPH